MSLAPDDRRLLLDLLSRARPNGMQTHPVTKRVQLERIIAWVEEQADAS